MAKLIVLFTVLFFWSIIYAGSACKDDNIWMADSSYNCSYLLNPDNTYGLYNMRHDICNGLKKDVIITHCCQTCRVVRNESITASPPTTIQTTKTSEKPENVDCGPGLKLSGDTCTSCEFGTYQPLHNKATCLSCGPGKTTKIYGATSVEHCIPDTECKDVDIWIASSSYDCSMLKTDTNRAIGIYKNRHRICNGTMPILSNCCQTCRNLFESKATTASMAAEPTIKYEECVDTYLYFENKRYSCDALISPQIEPIQKASTLFPRKMDNPANRIYNARHDFCSNGHETKTTCCSTCRQIQNENPAKVEVVNIVIPTGHINVDDAIREAFQRFRNMLNSWWGQRIAKTQPFGKK